MNAHTPGPWTAKIATSKTECCGAVASSIGYIKADTDHREIAVLYSTGNGNDQEANAHLIAAAPDLYDAMTGAMQYLDETLGPCDDDCECLLHSFHAAIAKAEGRS